MTTTDHPLPTHDGKPVQAHAHAARYALPDEPPEAGPVTDMAPAPGQHIFSTGCPPWADCGRIALHQWADTLDNDGTQGRYHQGPQFGHYVYISGTEYAATEGVVTASAGMAADEMEREWTARELVSLARECLAAAEWLGAHR